MNLPTFHVPGSLCCNPYNRPTYFSTKAVLCGGEGREGDSDLIQHQQAQQGYICQGDLLPFIASLLCLWWHG